MFVSFNLPLSVLSQGLFWPKAIVRPCEGPRVFETSLCVSPGSLNWAKLDCPTHQLAWGLCGRVNVGERIPGSERQGDQKLQMKGLGLQEATQPARSCLGVVCRAWVRTGRSRPQLGELVPTCPVFHVFSPREASSEGNHVSTHLPRGSPQFGGVMGR